MSSHFRHGHSDYRTSSGVSTTLGFLNIRLGTTSIIYNLAKCPNKPRAQFNNRNYDRLFNSTIKKTTIGNVMINIQSASGVMWITSQSVMTLWTALDFAPERISFFWFALTQWAYRENTELHHATSPRACDPRTRPASRASVDFLSSSHWTYKFVYLSTNCKLDLHHCNQDERIYLLYIFFCINFISVKHSAIREFIRN
jgi:hypothetical protein